MASEPALILLRLMFLIHKCKTMFGCLRPKRRRVLPRLDILIDVEFKNGSFVAPNPWHRAKGFSPPQTEPICAVGFGVSPLQDRIYVDCLWVHEPFRREGYASALLLGLTERVSPSEDRLAITALHEVQTSRGFWVSLRAGLVPGLTVTFDLRVPEMAQEAKRWREPLVEMDRA